MEFTFCYNYKNRDFKYVFTKSSSFEGVDIKIISSDMGLSAFVIPIDTIIIKEFFAIIPNKFKNDDILFLNGFQSWTDSYERTINSRMRGLKRLPYFIQKKYDIRPYGDYDIVNYSEKRGELHGFTYAYIKNQDNCRLIGSLSERFAYTIINFNTKKSCIKIEKDCRGLQINKEYKAFDIAFLNGDEDKVFDEYFNLMAIEPIKSKPIKGYTSWYNYYQNISEKILERDLNSFVSSGVKFNVFQIDDGYQTKVGDWLSVDKIKFPNGMKNLADKIIKADIIPGIWMAPFACEKSSDIVENHSDWLLKDGKGQLISGGGNWGGFYVLDFYNEHAREYIKQCFNVFINEWGFRLLKLDFLYAAALCTGNKRTRGRVMCEVMDFIRENTEGALLLGCGVPLGPAFGKVDYCRIGCDVGLDYDDKWYMRFFHRERVSTKNAMRNAVGRRQLSGRAFYNDPDVFLLRKENISLTERQKELLARINSLTGEVLFTSDNISEYNKRQKDVFNKTINSSPKKISVIPNKSGLTVKYKLEKYKI